MFGSCGECVIRQRFNLFPLPCSCSLAAHSPGNPMGELTRKKRYFILFLKFTVLLSAKLITKVEKDLGVNILVYISFPSRKILVN